MSTRLPRDRATVLAGLAAVVAFGGVLVAPERPDPGSTDPGLPALESVPATPAAGATQTFCAQWNTWVDAQAVYVDGGDPYPAVEAGRELLRLANRLTLTQDDRAGLQFLLEPYAGPSQLTVVDLGVNNRNARSFVDWLGTVCV